MGSQLRFDPSFFGLALRASAEADALFFSAHKDLSITRCPTRAGLRLTSPAKASGVGEVGGSGCIKNKRGTRHASRARNTPQYIIACQGADVKGNGTGAMGSRSE